MWIVVFESDQSGTDLDIVGHTDDEKYANDFCDHANIQMNNYPDRDKIQLLNGATFFFAEGGTGSFMTQEVLDLKCIVHDTVEMTLPEPFESIGFSGKLLADPKLGSKW